MLVVLTIQKVQAMIPTTAGLWKKVQDLLEEKEIEFYAPEILNVITSPISKHGRDVNIVEDDMFVTAVDELVTPLRTIKRSQFKAGLFLGRGEGFHLCLSLPTGFHLLKASVQRLMDAKEI